MVHAAKVWFLCDGYVCCHARADSDPARPQYDTVGGRVEPNETYAEAAHREVLEEALIPPDWETALASELASYPQGHQQTQHLHPRRMVIHQIATWFIDLPTTAFVTPMKYTQDGPHCGLRESLDRRHPTWRSIRDVLANLRQFSVSVPYVTAFENHLSASRTAAAEV